MLVAPGLGRDQIVSYLEAEGHSLEAYRAVVGASQDLEWVREAGKRFPEDPDIVLRVVQRNAFPGEAMVWAERFKQLQPDNALAAYLLAAELFESGEVQAGLDELGRGATLSRFDSFMGERALASRELYRQLGSDPEEARVLGFLNVLVPHASVFHEIGNRVQNLINEADSPERVHKLALLGAAMGNQITQANHSGTSVEQLLGLHLEGTFLRRLDPGWSSPELSDPVAQLLEGVENDLSALRGLAQSVDMEAAYAEGLMGEYVERTLISGEAAAIEWLHRRMRSR